MKENVLYTFYSDEDVVGVLKDTLNIKDDSERTDPESKGLFEVGNAPLSTQLKELKWSIVSTGRFGILYYIECYMVDDEDGGEIPSINIVHANIVVRHQTKEAVREENAKKIQDALTVLSESDIL